MANTLIYFLLNKIVSSFCYSYFCSKNINVFENTLATTINEFVINEHKKLAMFWTTGAFKSMG